VVLSELCIENGIERLSHKHPSIGVRPEVLIRLGPPCWRAYRSVV